MAWVHDTFTLSDTARKAARICDDEGISQLMYDAVGMGAGIRGPIREVSAAQQYRFATVPCQFGGVVQGPEVNFIRGRQAKTNKAYFANWDSQAGWAVRMRAENTQRLVNGESVNPAATVSLSIQRFKTANRSWPKWHNPNGTTGLASSTSTKQPPARRVQARVAQRLRRGDFSFSSRRSPGPCP